MHWKFKWEVYKEITDSHLFIESDYKQALEIAKISNKPVFCTENSQFVNWWFFYDLQTNFIPRLIDNKICRGVGKIIPNFIKKQ